MPEAPLPDAARMEPPSPLLMLAEGRAILEVGLGLLTAPAMRLLPRGDGHAVLVLPGFLASDRSTFHLRDVLKARGYAAVGWELGQNRGGIGRLRQALLDRLGVLYRDSGRKVSLVGWSLGGVLARDLALLAPFHVRQVITLGSPFNGDIGANNVRRIYEAMAGEKLRQGPLPAAAARLADDLGMPASAIYTKTDGVVAWQTCKLRPTAHAENIEVLGASHMALGFNPAVVWAVADRLAQPEGQFAKFRRRGPFAPAYGKIE